MAYITKYKAIDAIPEKDKIGLMTFETNSYETIVQKEEYKWSKLNKFVAYFENDSILPEYPEFEFLRKRCYSEKYGGFVIRPMKMAGLVSKGIVFPIETIMKIAARKKKKIAWYEDGFDLTELCEVGNKGEIQQQQNLERSRKNRPNRFYWKIWNFLEKYTFIPSTLKRLDDMRNGTDFTWPENVQKTDETRAENFRNFQQFVNVCKGKRFYVSVKEDGTSLTFYYKDKVFKICSRNNCVLTMSIGDAITTFTKPGSQFDERLTLFKIKNKLHKYISRSQMPESVWESVIHVTLKYEIPLWLSNAAKAFDSTFDGVYIQGELTGPGIQKNKMGRKEAELSIFNLVVNKLPNKVICLNEETKDVMAQEYGIPKNSLNYVKEIIPHGLKNNGVMTEEVFNNVKEFIAASRGNYDNGTPREGLVWRFIKETPGSLLNYVDYMNGEIGATGVSRGSFKIINDDFILKYANE